MSAQTAPQPTKIPLDPNTGLERAIADQLIPLFLVGAGNRDLARKMAISAVEAYNPEARVDFVNIARTLAFSIAALSLVGHAVQEDLELSGKMKVFGRANALNRSADQSERTMMQRRRYRNAKRKVAPAPNLSDAQIAATVGQAVSRAMERGKIAKDDQPPAKTPESTTEIVKPPLPPSAIRYASPMPTPTQPRSGSNRDALLQNTAMHSLAGQNGIPHPA